MSIHESITRTQSDEQEYRAYAVGVWRAGFNVLPMRTNSKKPALDTWTEYMHRAQTEDEVAAFSWGPNIAIVNGVNDIRTADIDACSDPQVVFDFLTLLGLDFEYPWVVCTPGKGGGYHIHLRCTERLTLTAGNILVGVPKEEGSAKFNQIELRWSNHYTMFPPSVHPDANEPYDWHFNTPQTPLAVVPVALVEKAFLTLTTRKSQSVSFAAPDLSSLPEGTETKHIRNLDAWTQKALTQELGFVRESGQGQRNHQLNKSAFALGQIVAMALLDAEWVAEELLRAATFAGLDEKESLATIKSGLEAGRNKPRMPRQIFQQNEPKYIPPPANTEDEALLQFTADDQGNAEAVASVYGEYLAYNASYDWLVWTGKHFEPAVHRVTAMIVEVLRRRHRAAAHLERLDVAKISRCDAGRIAACRTLLEKLVTVEVGQFDNEPDLINTQNGIVNMRTKALIPHDPSYHFTWVTSVGYKPDAANSPASDFWIAFVDETVVSPGIMMNYLQEALGYSITGYTSEEILLYVFGPPRSGKGTLSETLLAIFPRPIAIEVDFNTFTAKREGDNQNFDLAPMKAARLVFASESNKYQSLNPAKVKALTGGNLVRCAFKYGAHFEYQPQYVVWLSSNHEVNADAEDDALWGRVQVIGFPNSRLGYEDKSLKRRMQMPENLEAVLAWLVEGAYRWFQHGGKGLKKPEPVRELTEHQRAAQDSVGIWIEECCTLDPDSWVENTRVYKAYEMWCENNGYEPKKANSFGRSLAAHKLQVGVKKTVYTTPGTAGEKMRGIQGLRID